MAFAPGVPRVPTPPVKPPVGQPYGSDALDRASRGEKMPVTQDALGRAMARANQNRGNFGAVRPHTPEPVTPLGGIAPSPGATGARLGGVPQYRSPLAKHGTRNPL